MRITLDRKRLDISFYLCFILLMALPALFPKLRLTFFAPFLIIVCYKKPLQTCLWLALLCGLIMDMLASHARLGLYALDYCLAVAIIFPLRRNFFADSLSTLPIMTFFFSIISTVFIALLVYSIEMKNVFSLPWILTDLLFMPMIDALYAFVGFILPSFLFGKSRKRSKNSFHSI